MLSCSMVFASETSRDDLLKLQQEIKQLQYELNKKEKDRGSTQNDLSTLERQISGTLKSIRENTSMLNKLKDTLSTLNEEKALHQDNLKKQQAHLKTLIIEQYKQGKAPQLKLLLNQQDPVLFGRALIYNRYLNQSYSSAIQTLQQSLEALENTEKRIHEQQTHLAEIQNQHQEKKRQLEEKRTQRQSLLAQLQSDINKKGQQLNTLLENEKLLKQTLDKLEQRIKSKPAPRTKNKARAFSKRKGSLPWPTKGKIKRKFGSRKGSSLKWQGVVIGTAPEQDVMSVAPGTIVFSDWLRGFGMLVIVDHGNGYISLYGQNETLFKEVGNSVEQNEVISSVGEGPNSELYFELRHKGKPINPVPWFKK